MGQGNDPETYSLIGAAMEVHREQGSGFLEPVYQECLEIELNLRGIPFSREYWTNIRYKGHTLQKKYKCDFVCFGTVVLELKACAKLLPEHRAQTLNYLRATGLNRALLINFGQKSLEYERIVLDYNCD